MIGLILSRDSVKSSSLDSGSNATNRQIITVLPFYGITQNSAYSLAEATKKSTDVGFFVNMKIIYDSKIS